MLQLKQTNNTDTSQDNSYTNPAILAVPEAGTTVEERFVLEVDDPNEYYTKITIKDVDLQAPDETSWLKFAPDINGAPGSYSSTLKVPDLGSVAGQPEWTIYYDNFNRPDNPTAISDDPSYYVNYPYGRLPYSHGYEHSGAEPSYPGDNLYNWKAYYGIKDNMLYPSGVQRANIFTPEQSKPTDFSFWQKDPTYGADSFVGPGSNLNGYASFWSDDGLPFPDPVIHLMVNPTGNPFGTPYEPYEAPVVIKSMPLPVDPNKFYTFEIGAQEMVYQQGRVVVYFYDSEGNEIGQKVNIDDGMPSSDYYYYIDWNSIHFGPGDYMPSNTAQVAFSWGITDGRTFAGMEHIFEYAIFRENYNVGYELSMISEPMTDWEFSFDTVVIDVSTSNNFGFGVTNDNGRGITFFEHSVIGDFGSFATLIDKWPVSGDRVQLLCHNNQMSMNINGSPVTFETFPTSSLTWDLRAPMSRFHIYTGNTNWTNTVYPDYPYANDINLDNPTRLDNLLIRALANGSRTSYPFWTKFSAPANATKQIKADVRIAADCIRGLN